MTLNCKGILLDLSSPKVMGILNVTPDSFYDGGDNTDGDDMKRNVNQMVADGVDIIDIGGMSSRPGARLISSKEELERVLPAVRYIQERYPNQLMSIDTLHSMTARRCVEHGVHIINDISGGTYDSKIIDVAIEYSCPYIMMHMQGTPTNMQSNPTYENVTLEIFADLANRVKQYRAKGLKDIVLDPGFGFGKTVEHNYELVRNFSAFRILDCPILAGISRKSMLYKPLNIIPATSLNATTALHMVLLQNGANILRVHDVKEAKECIDIYTLIQG